MWVRVTIWSHGVTAPFVHMFPKQAALCGKGTQVFAFHTNTVMLNYTCLAHGQLSSSQTFILEMSVCVFWLFSLKLVFQEKLMMVYVERRVVDDATLSKDEAFGSIRNQLCTFREGETHINAQLRRTQNNTT